MANKKTVTVTYSATNPTKPKYAPRDLTRLWKGDTVTIKLAGNFPGKSTIDTIEIDNNTIINGSDRKDTSSPLGSWTRSKGNGTELKGFFRCSAVSTTKVKITDIENNTDDDKFWYSVSGKIGGTKKTWSIDPELINKGKP